MNLSRSCYLRLKRTSLRTQQITPCSFSSSKNWKKRPLSQYIVPKTAFPVTSTACSCVISMYFSPSLVSDPSTRTTSPQSWSSSTDPTWVAATLPTQWSQSCTRWTKRSYSWLRQTSSRQSTLLKLCARRTSCWRSLLESGSDRLRGSSRWKSLPPFSKITVKSSFRKPTSNKTRVNQETKKWHKNEQVHCGYLI